MLHIAHVMLRVLYNVADRSNSPIYCAEFKVDSLYTALLDCTIALHIRSTSLPQFANLETDSQVIG